LKYASEYDKKKKVLSREKVKNKKFFEAEIVFFKEVLSLNPKNHIRIKKECTLGYSRV